MPNGVKVGRMHNTIALLTELGIDGNKVPVDGLYDDHYAVLVPGNPPQVYKHVSLTDEQKARWPELLEVYRSERYPDRNPPAPKLVNVAPRGLTRSRPRMLRIAQENGTSVTLVLHGDGSVKWSEAVVFSPTPAE